MDWGDEDDFDNFTHGQQAENTLKGNQYASNTLVRFMASMNKTRSIQSIAVDELDKILCKFFMTIKKKNGGDYEPDSLTTIQRGIQRHFDTLKLKN